MRERSVEAALVKAVREAGGLCLKWSSPAQRGVPDRLVFLPGGKMVAVEVKAPGRKPTPLQEEMHRRLRALGVDVRVVDSKEAAHGIA